MKDVFVTFLNKRCASILSVKRKLGNASAIFSVGLSFLNFKVYGISILKVYNVTSLPRKLFKATNLRLNN